jgi:hypothetical protein
MCVLSFLLCCFAFVVTVWAVRATIRNVRTSVEEARLRAKRRIAQEDEDISNAEAFLGKYGTCPKCKTSGGVIGKHYDCMDIVLDYCHHAWHSYKRGKYSYGTYDGKTYREAMISYGSELRRRGKHF